MQRRSLQSTLPYLRAIRTYHWLRMYAFHPTFRDLRLLALSLPSAPQRRIPQAEPIAHR
jgi:hypothetical protein